MAYLTDTERLNYYEGEYLGALDFEAEQDYHRDMRRRHNVGPHTWGIIAGLNLVQVPNSQTVSGALQVPTFAGCPTTGAPPNTTPTPVDVLIQPGVAADGFGREVVVLNQTQLTQDLFAAYYNPSGVPMLMQVWIAYQQQLAIGATDTCFAQNNANAYGRVVESFQLQVTPAGTTPANSSIMVAGTLTTPPPEPNPGSPPQTTTTNPTQITLPYDGSVPYQEFPEDDTTVTWWIPLGQVLWNPQNGAFYQIASDSAACNRVYVGSVCATIYAPAAQLLIEDRNSPYPPLSSADPNLGGAAVEVAGSLTVDFLLNVAHSVLIGEPYNAPAPPAKPAQLPPLTIFPVSTDTDQSLIQFGNSAGSPAWEICENRGGKSLGLDFVEFVATSGGSTTLVDRLFIQATQTTGSPPSPQNVGVGTLTPRNPLAIRSQGSWQELLSFEDPSGNTKWHLNQNPQGKDNQGNSYGPGLNFSETGVANFRLFLQAGGNVGVGLPIPQQNLSVNGGLNIDQAGGNQGALPTGVNACLTFGSASGEGIGSNRQPGTNQYGLDFYTDFAKRMSITQQGSVGIGSPFPQQNLSINGGLNIDQANANVGTLPVGTSACLTFGYASGEGIGSNRQPGTNQFGLDFYTDFAKRMSITQQGLVGIGTATPQQTLSVNGAVGISGNLGTDGNDPNTGYPWPLTGGVHTNDLYAEGSIACHGPKFFIIDHPLNPSGQQLIHAALEGPEPAVFYRGLARLSRGKATVTLPSYFEALTREDQRTVLLTARVGDAETVPVLGASDIRGGKFSVIAAGEASPEQEFYWEVKAVRKDTPPLVVEPAKKTARSATQPATAKSAPAKKTATKKK